MSRWSEKLGNSIHFALDKVSDDTFMENFFEQRAFIPQNEQERREFEDFSFVTCTMELAVYVAIADEEVSSEEKERIIQEVVFQLEQHHHEYDALSEKFGSVDKDIVNTLYDTIKAELLANDESIDEVIKLINKYYENNPYKKYYMLRLSYNVAYTESRDMEKEFRRVEDIARMLKIDDEQRDRIKVEVGVKFKK